MQGLDGSSAWQGPFCSDSAPQFSFASVLAYSRCHCAVASNAWRTASACAETSQRVSCFIGFGGGMMYEMPEAC